MKVNQVAAWNRLTGMLKTEQTTPFLPELLTSIQPVVSIFDFLPNHQWDYDTSNIIDAAHTPFIAEFTIPKGKIWHVTAVHIQQSSSDTTTYNIYVVNPAMPSPCYFRPTTTVASATIFLEGLDWTFLQNFTLYVGLDCVFDSPGIWYVTVIYREHDEVQEI